MQAAAEYNGSKSSSNVTSITTTTIADKDIRSGGDSAAAALPTSVAANTVTRIATATPAASAALTVTAAATSTTTPIAISPLLAEQQPATQNVLRNRLQLGKSTNNHNNFNASTATPYENGVQAQQRFDAAEYLGSNVEQMSVTPSPSPNVSPSKKASNVTSNNDAAANITNAAAITANATTTSINVVSNIIKIAQEANASPPPTLNSSSTSSSSSASATNSNSNSTTSSVIATPILMRNGNANGGGGVGGGSGNKTSKEQLFLATQTISLPIKSASFSTFGEHLINSSANATKNSTTASSSSVTPTTLTPTTNISANKKSIKSKKPEHDEEEELLQWKDMPQYLQFNPYVLKGYRPLQTFKGCLFSLFYWHNETINILTHAIPIVYILAIVPGLMPWDGGYRFLSFCHVFGSVAPWCGSFVYHLFMNIETGENCYYRLLKLDMIGIWVSQSFGALPLVTATTFCFPHKWKWFFIITYCLMSLWGLYKALTASSPWQRRLCFALPFTMRSILTFLRTLGWVGGNAVALPHVYLQDVVSIFGGAIGAMRIPEKWFPGLVDFYLNSHNIMHVLVVVAVYSMHKATIKDFEWMSATNCNSFTNATNETLETTLSANMEL